MVISWLRGSIHCPIFWFWATKKRVFQAKTIRPANASFFNLPLLPVSGAKMFTMLWCFNMQGKENLRAKDIYEFALSSSQSKGNKPKSYFRKSYILILITEFYIQLKYQELNHFIWARHSPQLSPQKPRYSILTPTWEFLRILEPSPANSFLPVPFTTLQETQTKRLTLSFHSLTPPKGTNMTTYPLAFSLNPHSTSAISTFYLSPHQHISLNLNLHLPTQPPHPQTKTCQSSTGPKPENTHPHQIPLNLYTFKQPNNASTAPSSTP